MIHGLRLLLSILLQRLRGQGRRQEGINGDDVCRQRISLILEFHLTALVALRPPCDSGLARHRVVKDGAGDWPLCLSVIEGGTPRKSGASMRRFVFLTS